MGMVYILMKKDDIKHTYSTRVAHKLIKEEGYKVISKVYGWNMSVTDGPIIL